MGKCKSKFTDSEKFVESQVLAWAFKNRWSIDVYDSKGTFSEARGRYSRNTGMKTGTADLMGVSSEGYFVALELKAPGKEGVCRLEQHSFLTRKIESNGFALVLSSVSFLEETWTAWLKLRNEGRRAEAQRMLSDLLPKKVIVSGRTLTLQGP